MPNSSRAAPILRFRSSHWTKQMILQVLSSRCSRWTCRTNVWILDPYLAKGNDVSSMMPPASKSCELLCRLSLKDCRSWIFALASVRRESICAEARCTSCFQASTNLRNLSAFSASESQSHVASSQLASPSHEVSVEPPATGFLQRGMPKCARTRAHRVGGGQSPSNTKFLVASRSARAISSQTAASAGSSVGSCCPVAPTSC
mmetsp:Transcript_54235/g.107992  ORF Transcript_54235/g.107992 Transcript_54235/m.107992 type:complete len:203 (-) Transcript_54235:1069-1677(-)